MNDEDVTHVTGNGREVPPELKLAIDLVFSFAMLYYAMHPDEVDELVKRASNHMTHWKQKLVHRLSIWTAKQDIRSLPEVEDNPE